MLQTCASSCCKSLIDFIFLQSHRQISWFTIIAGSKAFLIISLELHLTNPANMQSLQPPRFLSSNTWIEHRVVSPISRYSKSPRRLCNGGILGESSSTVAKRGYLKEFHLVEQPFVTPVSATVRKKRKKEKKNAREDPTPRTGSLVTSKLKSF